MSKQLLAILALALVLGAGVFAWFQMKPKADQVATPAPIVSEPTVIPSDTIDTSDWKTYRNEEYGFEFKYPGDWNIQETMTAEVGLPVDCQQKPLSKECHHFTVRIFSPGEADGAQDNIVVRLRVNNGLDASNIKPATALVSGDEIVTSTQWIKKVGKKEFIKTNTYFPIYGSCYTTAHIPETSLKNEYVLFEVFYEVSGSLNLDKSEMYCSQEIKDSVFDSVVASFSVL